jgi:SAM-dependent methyltransferase
MEFLGLGPRSSAVEFGAGIGYLTIPMLRRGCQVTATDISQGELDILSENARLLGVTSGLHALQGQPASLPEDWRDAFDCAVTSSVLHHIEDPYDFVRRMTRFVKPGGWCGGMEPNAASPTTRLIHEIGFLLPSYTLMNRDAERNWTSSREERIRDYAIRAGLENVEVVKFDLFPRPFLSQFPFLDSPERFLTSIRPLRSLCITLLWKAQKPHI